MHPPLLVVEDDDTIRETIRDVLVLEGFEVLARRTVAPCRAAGPSVARRGIRPGGCLDLVAARLGAVWISAASRAAMHFRIPGRQRPTARPTGCLGWKWGLTIT